MALDWRNLPAVIRSTETEITEQNNDSSQTQHTYEVDDDDLEDVVIDSRDESASSEKNDEIVVCHTQGTQPTHRLHANGIKVIYETTEIAGEHTSALMSHEHDQAQSHASGDGEEEEEEEKKKRRRAKIEAKIREKYGDYFESDAERKANELQTVRYRAPRRTLGCPHWRIGCKYEGDEYALAQHLQNCPFERMKAMIRKRDHQINGLQHSHQQLQHQVSQLHSILSSFVSLQSSELQNYLLSQLPNNNHAASSGSNASSQSGLHLTRNISSELYDAPRTAINLSSLHSLDGETRSVAYDRRRYNNEMIKRHRDSIKGALILQWHTKERFIDEHSHMHMNGSHLLTPSVNFANSQNTHSRHHHHHHHHHQHQQHRLSHHHTSLLSLPSNIASYTSMHEKNNLEKHTVYNYKDIPSSGGGSSGGSQKKENAIRALIMFWNRVVSASDHGVQVWNIDTYNHNHNDGDYDMFRNTRNNNNSHRQRHHNSDDRIKQLSFDSMLCNEASFSLATQPFAHPYWLFTGHQETIRAWKYNGAQFNTSCTCNACMLSFSSHGFGAVRCLAVSADHVFASSDSNVIQFWKFSESLHTTTAATTTTTTTAATAAESLQRSNSNVSSSSTHSLGAAHALDKRNAFGHVEYVGHLVCGHRGMITALKVFGDVLISGSKDGFITIWSITKFVNLSLLHYGPNAVLDFTIFPNPYPLCHMTIWNEHLNALSKHSNDNNDNGDGAALATTTSLSKHNNAVQKHHLTPPHLKQTPPKLINHEDTNTRWPSLPNEERDDIESHDDDDDDDAARNSDNNNNADTNANAHDNNNSKTWMQQYVSLNSLYENTVSTGQRNKIQDTIMDFCGHMNSNGIQTDNVDVDDDDDDDDDDQNILSNDDAPDVLASVFRAAIPSTPGSSNNSEDQQEMNKSLSPAPLLSPHESSTIANPLLSSSPTSSSSQPPQLMTSKQHHHHNHHHNNLRHHHNNEDEGQVLCREIMNTASGHFGINLISFILKDLKLIVGGHSGEIHIWHIGNRRSAFNMTPNWERESILRGHGDRVTRLEAFGNHLLSAYSNGSIKLWRCDDSDFVCTGTAYTNEVQSDAELDDDYDDNASLDNFFPKTSGLDYNSVRCLLLLPSPTLNLNSARDKHDMIPRSPNAWSSAFEDSDNISDDDMELNLNDFNVKISPNVNDKIYNGSSSGYTHAQRRKRIGKENSHIHSYYNHPFWILSGTCDGSLLMHKLDDGSNTNIHHQY